MGLMIFEVLHTPAQAHARAEHVTVLTVAFLAAAWITVCFRFFVRAVMIKSLGRDDWAMLATNILFTAYCTCLLRLLVDSPRLILLEQSIPGLFFDFKLLIASMVLYIATTVVFKIALAMFYLRVMVRPWQVYTVYATTIVSTVFGSAFMFFALFQCGNPVKFLDNELQGKCLPRATLLALNITGGLVNAFADWILALLPIVLVTKTTMPRSAKVSAAAVMVIGTLGSVCSVVRLVFVRSFMPNPDFFWSSLTFTMWSVSEAGCCIIAASLATLRPLLRCFIENARTLRSASGSHHPPKSMQSSNTTWRSHDALKRNLSAIDKGIELGNNRGTSTSFIGQNDVKQKQDTTHEVIERQDIVSATSPRPQHVVHQIASPPRANCGQSRRQQASLVTQEEEELIESPPRHVVRRDERGYFRARPQI